ncbi:hypothetical protein HON86_00860 [Candidatus Woesearchaeota archaeon]|jgi:hypothetical protein|nr:hypothetical protein [Candidatus Woesearchaeota archaeon]MBT4835153.1 hypothetical protein [Candidatus Woesearchaeota archaeon]MBT6735387.1 hypothetical protein [Candidatus Woesearchaeota archaeon]MBT7170089.1 hypothetical protein [Candidatus Woesearchaeota archaeon]MBT7474816.1 hypothetical protein [Candidatus Woesearchaeota archaeon]
MKKNGIFTVLILVLLFVSFSYFIGSVAVKNHYLITGMITGSASQDLDCPVGVCDGSGEDTCGNGNVGPDEDCDGSNLNFKSCMSLGYDFGSLDCFADCSFDRSGCSYNSEEEDNCGNGICESFETCGSCVEDCVWKTSDCGDNGICYLNRGYGLCMPICEFNSVSVCVCGEQWNNPFGMILNEFGPNLNTGCSDENCRGEVAYCYVFPDDSPLPKPSSLGSNVCRDGSSPGECSLTKPLYCNSRKKLVYDCSACGCSAGYYCAENGICLMDENVPESNESVAPLWWQLENEYNLLEGNERINDLIRKGIDEDILLSSSSTVSDVVKIKNLQNKVGLSKEVISSADERIMRSQEMLVSDDARIIDDLFEISVGDVVGGRVLRGVIESASNSREEVPLFSPEDIMEVSCVDVIGGSCLGESDCCLELVCNAGICVDNIEVESVNIPVDGIFVETGYGLSNLVEVSGRSIESITEYETHPSFVESLFIPDSVNFGFYDIEVSEEGDGFLEFEVQNDLLVLNQIVAIGLYRLTSDGWESLDLVDIKYDYKKTVFRFETPGFSYFTLRGIKEGISFESLTSEKEGLWAVYRRSFTPGFALIEFFFGREDTLIFGILNDKPLLDLGIGSGF